MKQLFSLLALGILTCSTLAQPKTGEAQVNVIVTDMTRVIPEVEAKVVVQEEGTDNKMEGVTDTVGKYVVLLEQGKKYHFIIWQYGLDFDFGVKIMPKVDGPLNIDLKLAIGIDTIYQDVYTLENVYFDTDKATLKPESNEALDKFYKDLRNNPSMIVEIAGHTDNEGNDGYNLRLSHKRAQAVRDYLIEKGISQERIKAKGYGENAPIASNNTEEGRAKNRRTEVRIIVR